jgi:bifunctional UDP-N-acetylglucosamine pyrophosphorylase/glucosamine-1-phosphate N-acetyltransferase
LIVPAAGAGTRLMASTPKLLTPVGGRPMIDYLFDLYGTAVRRFVLVVHPSFENLVRDYCGSRASGIDVDYRRQPQPTGMLDAILLAADAVRSLEPARIWITWCDQIGIHPETVATLLRCSTEHPNAAMILPTARQRDPYIHIERDSQDRIVGICHRREGDAMPEVGESDAGLFSISSSAYFDLLPRFADEATQAASTGERNFLPFIPFLSHLGETVLTFRCVDDLEALGINTPEDRDRFERLRAMP